MRNISIEVPLQASNHLFIVGETAAVEGSNQSEAFNKLSA